MATMANENQGEMLDFLKRGEVRTMAKDIARLRKEEAKKEAERIETLGKTQSTPVSLMPSSFAKNSYVGENIRMPLPQKPQTFSKIFVRIVIVFIVIFVLINGGALVFWVLQKKSTTPPIATQPTSETQIPETSTPQLGAVAFPIVNTTMLNFSGGADGPSLLSQFAAQEQTQGFTRVVPQNPENKKILSAKDFLNAMQIPIIASVSSILEDNFTLFLYQTPQRKRMGITLSLSSEIDRNILKSWEPTLEQDLAPFFVWQGQKDKAYVKFFRPIAYKNTMIRCQTFSLEDFGICYALVNKNLVFTSSLESMRAVLNLL